MSTLREAAEEALRWMEHARLHLTIKERMHPDGLSLYDSATEALRAALAQPEAPCYVGDALALFARHLFVWAHEIEEAQG